MVAASTIQQFTRKLSELRLSFLLYNYVTYRRIFWQSTSNLNFWPVFGKNTKVIVHGFVKKWGSEVGNEIEPNLVRMYVYMSWKSIVKLTVITCLVFCKTVDFYVMFWVKICSGCGFNYTAIYSKTKRATTIVFLIQLHYI